jgi:hypothetical protein
VTMNLIIAGHIRSGTTLLRNLCHSHPDISVTMEFENYLGLGSSYRRYANRVLRKWWRDRHRSFLVQGENETRWRPVLTSHIFVARYLFELNRYCGNGIDVSAIEATLKAIFPKVSVVGDKMPYYVFQLEKLIQVNQLICIVIYRDCRDVVNSTLRMVRTNWYGRSFTAKYNTAGKVAKSWVKAIEAMEHYAEKIYIIRYEDLIQAPEREIQRLSAPLGVDSEGFPKGMIRKNSVGRHKGRLSEEELSEVMDIAGPTLTRLGYL